MNKNNMLLIEQRIKIMFYIQQSFTLLVFCTLVYLFQFCRCVWEVTSANFSRPAKEILDFNLAAKCPIPYHHISIIYQWMHTIKNYFNQSSSFTKRTLISRFPNIISFLFGQCALFRIIPHPPKFTCLELCSNVNIERCYSGGIYVLGFKTYDCNSIQQIRDFISHMFYYCRSTSITFFAQFSIL